MLSVLTVNIGAAAPPRAQAILDWLQTRDDDVVILTETSAGAGTDLLLAWYARAGYAVARTTGLDADRGAAIVSRVPVRESLTSAFSDVTLPHRVAGVVLDTDPALAIVGAYVPSRDRSLSKTEKKQTFIRGFLDALTALPPALQGTLLVGGDYNVISRDHEPRHVGFLPFEFGLLDELLRLGLVDVWNHAYPGEQAHSWIGRTGDGYRYDYFHLAQPMLDRLGATSYLHETREQRLTDHAAVAVQIAMKVPQLEVTDPTEDALSLF